MLTRAKMFGLFCLLFCGLWTGFACRPHIASPSLAPPESSHPAAGAPSGTRFVDVAKTAGLSYRWEIPGKRPLTILQTIGNGCAFLDYDNDGNLDILLVGPKIALYKGDGKGHFQDVSQATGLDRFAGHYLGCAVGDYDNDGYADIYISGYRTGLLLHNEQGKRFREVSAFAGLKAQPWGTSCAFGDIDGDGKLDLYVTNYLDFCPQTNPQLCNAYGYQTACGPLSYKPERGVLYHNLGGGRFQDVTHAWGADRVSGKALGVAFAPYRPGHMALAIANDEEAGDLMVMENGRLTNVGVRSGTAYSSSGKPQGGMGLDWGDYNNDGQLDLTIATFDDEAKPVYRNTEGIFEDQSQALGVAQATRIYVAFGIKWFDFDNDGWLDLILTNGHVADNVATYNSAHTYRQPSLLLHNLAGTRFEEIGGQTGPDLAKPLVGRGLAVGDYDNDGRMDLLLVDSEGAPVLLHNESAPIGHWLQVKLIGTKSPRDGTGTLVTAESEGRKLTRYGHTDGSYLSASDARVHFGLAAATHATLTVRWPDGRTDRYPDVAADQILTIREGAQTVSH